MSTGAVALIDVVDEPWPDGMGDPQSDAPRFGAWSMGFFGPFAFPECLRRSVDHAGWDGADDGVAGHRSFVRLLVTYAVGAMPTDPVLPPDYDALSELIVLMPLWRSLQTVRGARCAFNPNGEVLCGPAAFDAAVAFAKEADIPPVDLWTNVRLFRVDETWMLMDTVGMAQLDRVDMEACFPIGAMEPDAVAAMLRNLTVYAAEGGGEFAAGDTTDGPGGLWHGFPVDDGRVLPPRSVVRWFPGSSPKPPDDLIPSSANP